MKFYMMILQSRKKCILKYKLNIINLVFYFIQK